MRVHKDTPFEFSLMPWELEPPKTSLMVVVKATFDLVDDGECTISDAQVPCNGEVPWDDGDPPSLRTETDYAIYKPRGEWYVTGHAHAVGGAAKVGKVEVKIGRCQKRMVVLGDRVWKRGIVGATASEPKPFVRMPLRWERSFGGPRIPENPVGVGTAAIETEDGRVEPLPNFEDPSRLIVSKGEQPSPVGMFAIPSGWAARRALTGTYDEVWKAARWPYFPRDFRMEFFQAAPPDQRLPEGYWRGDETLELVGLHPELHRVRTRLPGLRARAFVEWVSRPSDAPRLETLSRAQLQALGRPKLRAIELALDTIVVDADAAQVLCTWRGLVKVADAQLSDVERLFFVHEPCSADHPLEHYEDWLLRKVMEEAAEFEDDDTEEAPDALPVREALPEPEDPLLGMKTSPEEIKSVDEAWANVGVALPVFLGRFVEPSPSPTHEELRARLGEYGVDPDTVLPPLEEIVTPPEPEEPRSFLRLAAIFRRRLGKSFAELDLSAMPFAKMDLSGVDFRGARLTDAELTGANLASCVFDGALLYRAKLGRTDARRASFRGADLTEMDASEARFDGSSFDGAVGSDAVFSRASFVGVSMVEVELAGAQLDGCELREAKLSGADFTGANVESSRFEASAMEGVSLEGARGAGAIFERCTMPDLRASDGAVFSGGRFILVDAPRSQFQGSALIGVNFGGSNLEQADFSDASLARSNFIRVAARGAIFDRADARECTFISAGLFEASFQEARIENADLRGAHLFSANLYRTRMDGALLDGANLTRTYLDGKK